MHQKSKAIQSSRPFERKKYAPPLTAPKPQSENKYAAEETGKNKTN